MRAYRLSTAAVLSFLFFGCAGSSVPTTIVRVKAEPSGTNCRGGGSRIESGADTDGNGALDPVEVTDTQYVCNGAPGRSGADGQRGSDGSMGQPGADAPKVLVRMVAEPAGVNCAHGGKQVLAGPDTNGNAVLDPSEVSLTSYVCDGAPGPGITWVSVTGTAQQADANTGYLANNPNARVVITLPVNPAVGDVVQVTGVGAGGFSIAQNAGQQIDARNLGVAPGTKWVARAGGTSGLPSPFLCRSIASSADGLKLVLACRDAVFTSTDGGATWVARGASMLPIGMLVSFVASSADGTKLVLVVSGGSSGGQIWLSSNSGGTWAATSTGSGLPTASLWESIASSADGTKLVAAEFGGLVWTSSNGGGTWVSHGGATSGLPATASWSAVASSADGTNLAAAAQGIGIYTSGDSGATWTAPSPTSGLIVSEQFTSLASSADGTKLVAVANAGHIWTSTSGGVSWTPRASVRGWTSVASSSDGVHLIAVSAELASGSSNDQIFASTDSGATWTAHESRRAWRAVASSADGSRLAAAAAIEGMSFSTQETTLGTTGGITGGRADTVSLQYTGAGVFLVLSASGSGFALQ